MSKKTDAEYYQQHRGDDSHEWERDPENESAPRSEKRRLTAIISVRFAPEEEAQLRRVAESRGRSVSRFIRELALREIAPRMGFIEASALNVTFTGSAPHAQPAFVDEDRAPYGMT